MFRKFFAAILLIHIHSVILSGQVKIRLFTEDGTESVIFSVIQGEYILQTFKNDPGTIRSGEPLFISRFNNQLLVKSAGGKGFLCDSVDISVKEGYGAFSLRTNGSAPVRKVYSGDLKCIPDLGTLLLINNCDIESYVAGVVKSEGGSGKDIEYCKSQAILARTYMFKNFNKHIFDGYDLCDGTHCQAFNGLANDSIITRAALETAGLVVLGPDRTLIISAFHSNCGGETAPSEDVWLSGLPYLKSVSDPYCRGSRNASWKMKISVGEWLAYLKKMGCQEESPSESLLNFKQNSRLKEFRAGSFSLPLYQIRSDLHLRSAFFSFSKDGDSLLIDGRGYGHGVGLCQEGAMVMASKGFDYKQIIDFYFKGVIISDIKNALVEK